MRDIRNDIEELYREYFHNEELYKETRIEKENTQKIVSKLNSRNDYNCLTLLFNQYKLNDNYEATFLKVSFLNKLYGTQLEKRHNIRAFSNAIVNNNINIDKKLAAGNPSVIEDIRWINKTEKKSNGEYSFATKFCHFHNPDSYIIYDDNVRVALLYYRESLRAFDTNFISDYKLYSSVIEQFQIATNTIFSNNKNRLAEFYLYKKGQYLKNVNKEKYSIDAKTKKCLFSCEELRTYSTAHN